MARTALLALAVLAAGCGAPTPTGSPDRLDCDLARFVAPAVAAGPAAAGDFNQLVLSAGSELGVYGAGLLKGWGEAGAAAVPVARQQIHAITGVSAGALLASHAFLGRDAFLADTLPAIGLDQLLAPRWLSLLWANARFDDAGKNRNQREVVLTDELINAVAQDRSGRQLQIGVTDLNSGRFLAIDMLRLARELQPESRRNDCYRAVVGASTAIPVLMGPKFVDGLMLTDGAVRRPLFALRPPAGALAPGAQRRLLVLLHHDLATAPAQCQGDNAGGQGHTCNGLLAVAARSAELATDQAMKDALRAVQALARQPSPAGDGQALFDSHYATAAQAMAACAPTRRSACPRGQGGGDPLFCVPYMQCLTAQGVAAGRAMAGGNSPWQRFEALDLDGAPAPQRAK